MSSCGECTLCCKLYAIPAINKPEHKWCKDCTPGKGCNIYETRPEVCKEYQCLWLAFMSKDNPELRPDKIGMVFQESGIPAIGLVCHVDTPDAHNTPSGQKMIQAVMRLQKILLIVYKGNGHRIYCYVNNLLTCFTFAHYHELQRKGLLKGPRFNIGTKELITEHFK